MDPKTLKALKGSIKKWERIVSGNGRDEGPSNCPLCRLFNTPEHEPDQMCMGCPVVDSTGMTGCDATPYESWAEFDTSKVFDKETKAIALDELRFLKSLLPKPV